jgi:hypothetical protein
VGPQWQQHIVAELDSALNKWVDSVPDYRKSRPSRPLADFSGPHRLYQCAGIPIVKMDCFSISLPLCIAPITICRSSCTAHSFHPHESHLRSPSPPSPSARMPLAPAATSWMCSAAAEAPLSRILRYVIQAYDRVSRHLDEHNSVGYSDCRIHVGYRAPDEHLGCEEALGDFCGAWVATGGRAEGHAGTESARAAVVLCWSSLVGFCFSATR